MHIYDTQTAHQMTIRFSLHSFYSLHSLNSLYNETCASSCRFSSIFSFFCLSVKSQLSQEKLCLGWGCGEEEEKMGGDYLKKYQQQVAVRGCSLADQTTTGR